MYDLQNIQYKCKLCSQANGIALITITMLTTIKKGDKNGFQEYRDIWQKPGVSGALDTIPAP